MRKVFLLLNIALLLPFSARAENGTLVPLQKNPSAGGPVPSADIHDIYPLLPTIDAINWFLIALFALGLLLLVALAAVFWLMKRRERPLQLPAIPAHEVALAELEKARHHIEDNDSILYANRVSEILRIYIEDRFRIRSTRQTTMEFLSCVDTMAASPAMMLTSYRQHLAECLHHCDLAKYAHRNSTREILENLEGRIRHFIEDTAEKKEA